jgi:hypothetical protein
VRENLLNVLGAGITEFTALAYPAAMPVSLAILVWLEEPGEVGSHEFRVVVEQGDSRLAEIEVRFAIQSTRETPDDFEGPAPFVVDLRPIQTPEPGHITLQLMLDGQPIRRLHLLARQVTAG